MIIASRCTPETRKAWGHSQCMVKVALGARKVVWYEEGLESRLVHGTVIAGDE